MKIIPPGQSPCLSIVLLPIRAPANALVWLAQKVHTLARHCVGFFTRIGIFMFGEYNKGFWQREIIELFKVSPCDPGNRSRFSKKRLSHSIDILEALGGMSFTTWPADGAAKIKGMHFRVSDVEKMIKKNGGKWENGIISCEDPSDEWKTFCKDVLLKMGWDEQKNGTIKTRRSEKELPPGHLIINSHSPTSSYGFDRKFIGYHLGLGADVAVYDPRGVFESTGDPTEGGNYLDIESVYDFLKDEYPPEKTFTAGFCKGAAIAAHLKRLYPEMIFIGENTFGSLRNVLKNQTFPGNVLGPFGLPTISSTRPEITSRVNQDMFNTAKKLWEMDFSLKGASVFIHTTTDNTVGSNNFENLKRAAHSTGPTYAYDYTPEKKGNGHSVDPLVDPVVWRWYAGILTALAKEQSVPVPSQTPTLQVAQPANRASQVKVASRPTSYGNDQPRRVVLV